MTRLLDIIFRNMFRLLVLLVVLPALLIGVNYYFQRSYVATETLWVGDPGVFGAQAAGSTGYNNYLSPAQNANKSFSALIATQKFRNALGDALITSGSIQTQAERDAVIASLDQLTASTVISGASTSGAGSSGGGSTSAEHTLTIRYVCRHANQCLPVLAQVVDVYRVQQADLVASTAAAARAVYKAQEQAAESALASAIAAVQKYEAQHPIKPGKTTEADPELATLQHQVDLAEAGVDQSKQRLSNIDLAEAVSNGMISSMRVVDGPNLEKGLYGLKGFRNDNLKADGIALAACVAAATIYVMLVAFLEHTIRDPNEVMRRLKTQVVTIPEYVTSSGRGWRPRWPGRRRDTA